MIIDDRYKILRVIGRGGTSCVFLAENIRLNNYWAIKEVYKNGFDEHGNGSSFLVAESQVLTRLRHQGLPAIVDIMATDQSYLIVMEYIEGISLDKVLAERGPQLESDVVKWGGQLCDVLDYLHRQNPPIIYRDMKPANIMLKPDGNVVLIDFGMAREFKNYSQRDTTYLGTHGYAAPEQYGGFGQTDPRSDVYSLGVTLYHLVTGHDPCLPPYGIRPIRTLNPALSWGLEQAIIKSTQLKAEERYQSAMEFKNAISGNFRIPVFTDNTPKKKNSSLLWLLILLPIFLVVLILVIFLVVLSSRQSPEPQANGVPAYVETYSPEPESASVVTAPPQTPKPAPTPTPSPTPDPNFVLPGSDTKYITKKDLEGFTAEQCRLARNEIYARHGRKFADKALQEYFDSKHWYIPLIEPEDFTENMLNDYEKANRDLIIEYEKEKGFR